MDRILAMELVRVSEFAALAAAALESLGVSIEGQLIFYNDQEMLHEKKTRMNDLNKFYSLDGPAHSDIMFSATGMTDGAMLNGIKITRNYAETHSIVMKSKTGTIRHINVEDNSLIKKLDY